MLDRVAATWDGLLVLNIVVCASASPKRTFLLNYCYCL